MEFVEIAMMIIIALLVILFFFYLFHPEAKSFGGIKLQRPEERGSTCSGENDCVDSTVGPICISVNSEPLHCGCMDASDCGGPCIMNRC